MKATIKVKLYLNEKEVEPNGTSKTCSDFGGGEMTEILQIVREFKKKVSGMFGKVEVILFGSYAKANAERESDIDILVILNRDVHIKVKEAIYDIAYELSLE